MHFQRCTANFLAYLCGFRRPLTVRYSDLPFAPVTDLRVLWERRARPSGSADRRTPVHERGCSMKQFGFMGKMALSAAAALILLPAAGMYGQSGLFQKHEPKGPWENKSLSPDERADLTVQDRKSTRLN